MCHPYYQDHAAETLDRGRPQFVMHQWDSRSCPNPDCCPNIPSLVHCYRARRTTLRILATMTIARVNHDNVCAHNLCLAWVDEDSDRQARAIQYLKQPQIKVYAR